MGSPPAQLSGPSSSSRYAASKAASHPWCGAQLPEVRHIRYVAYDFKAAVKRPGGGLLADIAPVIARCLDATGFFLCAPAPPGLSARRAGPADWVRPRRLYT